jgi:RHS repeat-associated protein
MILEVDMTSGSTVTTVGDNLAAGVVFRRQVWGLDLGGRLPQATGGVGGLLSVTTATGETHLPLLDGNGNVMGWYAQGGADDGKLLARYDYGPFGNRITNTNPALTVDTHPFGFSSKYTDEETGLVYYGFRFYDPVTGRWPSRDPIGERGGVNLYGMVGNDAVNGVDYLGLLKPCLLQNGGLLDRAEGASEGSRCCIRWGEAWKLRYNTKWECWKDVARDLLPPEEVTLPGSAAGVVGVAGATLGSTLIPALAAPVSGVAAGWHMGAYLEARAECGQWVCHEYSTWKLEQIHPSLPGKCCLRCKDGFY